MRTRNIATVLVALAAALCTALALAMSSGAQSGGGGSSKLKASLTGAAERPGPGDSDGRGRARITLLREFNAVCFRLRWRNIAAPTAAHIHRGAADEPGPVVVGLFDANSVRRRGCVDGVERSLLREIRRNPDGFYVNIHNADFPNGAIRGQLERAGRNRGRGGR